MKVVCTMLVGPGTEHLIRDALISARHLAAEWVLIDTRPDGSPPLLVEGKYPELLPGFSQFVDGWGKLEDGGTDTVHLHHFPWRNDYAAARNAALGFASLYGATHALTLDTDERLDGLDPIALDNALEEGAECDVFLLRSTDFAYCKERVIRLGSFPEWIGPTHEELVFNKPPPIRTYTLPGCFSELDKGDPSKPENQKKLESHLTVLQQWLKEQPERAKTRWYRYMGESAFGLRRYELAHEYFYRGSTHANGGAEEKAWCCIRGAECLAVLNKPDKAVKEAIAALCYHPGFLREIGYLVSWAYSELKAYGHALEWAWLGINNEPSSSRRGTLNPAALPGCWRVVLVCAKAAGDERTAAFAESELAKLCQPSPKA